MRGAAEGKKQGVQLGGWFLLYWRRFLAKRGPGNAGQHAACCNIKHGFNTRFEYTLFTHQSYRLSNQSTSNYIAKAVNYELDTSTKKVVNKFNPLKFILSICFRSNFGNSTLAVSNIDFEWTNFELRVTRMAILLYVKLEAHGSLTWLIRAVRNMPVRWIGSIGNIRGIERAKWKRIDVLYGQQTVESNTINGCVNHKKWSHEFPKRMNAAPPTVLGPSIQILAS